MSWVERLVEDCHWQADDGEVRAIARRAIEEAARRCELLAAAYRDGRAVDRDVSRAIGLDEASATIRAMLADDGAEKDG